MTDSREVTRLRKSGRLEEAMQLARELLSGDPQNLWNRWAMAWCLYEYLKTIHTADEIQACGKEFKALTLPEEDSMIHENWERVWAQKSDPEFGKVLAQSRDKTCPPADALELCRNMRNIRPENPQVAVSGAWAVSKLLRNTETPSQVEALGAEYSGHIQPYLEVPSPAHSIVLAAMISRVDQNRQFLKFFLSWGLEGFRNEDWFRTPMRDGNKEFPALVEEAAKAVAHGLKGLPYGWTAEKESDSWRKLNALADWMKKVRLSFPDNEWLPYYEAEVFLRLGARELALSRMQLIVRLKPRESWAWHKLALCMDQKDEKHLACLCKALNCGAPEEYVLGTKVDAAQAWAAQDRMAEANHLLLEVLAARQQRGWRISQELLGYSVLWKDQGDQAPAAREVERLCEMALEAVVEQDCWEEGLLVDRFTSKKGKTMATLAFQSGREPVEIRVQVSQFPRLETLERGSPLFASLLEQPGREDLKVWSVRERDAALWAAPFCKVFNGKLEIPTGREFGFICNIFTPPALIQEAGLQKGQHASGIAMKRFDIKKGMMGWSAVCLESQVAVNSIENS